MPVVAVDPWWVGYHDDVAARALTMLRMESASDPDLTAVNRAVYVIGPLIDAELDRCDPLPALCPEPILEAAALATCNQYRRKDAPFGTTGGWSDTGTQAPVHPDPLYGVRSIIAPWKQRWGLA